MTRILVVEDDQALAMVIIEGILYGVIGTFWGSIAGIGTIIITLLATLVPLKRAARMNIIESIRREE